MKTKIILFILLAITYVAKSQTIYTKTFGNSNDKPLIYLHGGPGYNASTFEITTAQKLSEKGFFVIVYDRRGEGRSEDKNAKFTFQETFDDIIGIFEQYKLKKTTLIGHSFGGILATLFAEKYPEKTSSAILVSSPIALQESFKTIIDKSKSIYEFKKDSTNLNYINMLKEMDKSSIEYSSYCFGHAMQNQFYSTKNPNDLAKSIYSTFKIDVTLKQFASKMDYIAPQGFWQNEKYTTIDLIENLKKLKANKTKIFALFGKEDGLYSAKQITDLGKIIGSKNLNYLENCSHNFFIDQQVLFLSAIKNWVK